MIKRLSSAVPFSSASIACGTFSYHVGCTPAALHASVLSLRVIDLGNWSWHPRWKQRLNDDYLDGSCGMGGVHIVVLVRIQDYDVRDGTFVRIHLNAADETLPFSSVSKYAREFNNRLGTQRFVDSG